MPFWTSNPGPVTSPSGTTVQLTGIRANHIDDEGQSVSVSLGGLEPQLTSASGYDWPTDTLTLVISTTSGTVPLQLYSGPTLVDTIQLQITVGAGGTGTAQWSSTPGSGSGAANANYVIPNVFASHVNLNGDTGIIVGVTGLGGSTWNPGADTFTVQLGATSGTATLELRDTNNGNAVVSSVVWSYTITGGSGGGNAFWTGAPSVSGAVGQQVTIPNVRASFVNENGNTGVTISNSSLLPELTAFSYTWATDSITLTIGAAGSVGLDLWQGSTVVGTTVMSVAIGTATPEWNNTAIPAATGNAGDDYVLSNVLANYVNANGATGLTVTVVGPGNQEWSAGSDSLTVLVPAASASNWTLQLRDGTNAIVDTKPWLVVVGGATVNGVCCFDDIVTVSTNTAVVISPLNNDLGLAANGIIDAIVSSPNKGTVSLSADNRQVTYTPGNGSTGADSFKYRARNTATGETDEAYVYLVIGALTLRAERTSPTSVNGYVKGDAAGYGHSTNVFGTMEVGDFVEWDLSDPLRPVLNQRMTWDALNLSVARAFPTRYLGSLFGKLYDVYGYNQSPSLIDAIPAGQVTTDGYAAGDRGTLWEQAPAADLLEVQELQGYPARIDSLPDTTVFVDAVLDATLQNNLLIDAYAHNNGVNTINGDIQPPFSKHLNVQIQLDRAQVRSTIEHAWGFSGAQVFGGNVTFGTQVFRYGFKLETLNGNNFPFISFCGWDGSNYVRVTEINITNVWNWVVANWDSRIKVEAQGAGITGYDGVTQASLLASSCDGIHIGSEVLGGGTGSITFNDLRVVINENKQVAATPQWSQAPDAGTGVAGDDFTIPDLIANHVTLNGGTVFNVTASGAPVEPTTTWSAANDALTVTLTGVPGTVTLRLLDAQGTLLDTIEWPVVTNTTGALVELVPQDNSAYQVWLSDQCNDPYRLFLAEIDYIDDADNVGTHRFASEAWLSDENQPYYEGIVDTPNIVVDRDDFGVVGDLEVINTKSDGVDWKQYTYKGHEARYFYGDKRWPRSQFRRLATMNNKGLLPQSDNRYIFDIESIAARYDRKISDTEVTINEQTQNAIHRVLALSGINANGGFSWGGISNWGQVNFTVTENSNLENVLRMLGRGADAFPRIDQRTGELHMIGVGYPNAPEHEFNENNIIDGTLNVVDTIEPVETVIVTWGPNQEEVEVPTGASINGAKTEIRYETFVSTAIFAQFSIGATVAARYAKQQNVWQFEITGTAPLIELGDKGLMTHYDVEGEGVVIHLDRKPLIDRTIVEVLI